MEEAEYRRKDGGVWKAFTSGFTDQMYCTFCYHRMPLKNSNIASREQLQEYFDLYKDANMTLDEADIQLVSRLFRFCGMCPNCHHPFGLYKKSGEPKAKRAPHVQTSLEIISCWVFIVFVWWWLVALLFIPAFCVYLMNKLNVQESSENKKLKAYTTSNATKVGFGDFHKDFYQKSFDQALEKVQSSRQDEHFKQLKFCPFFFFLDFWDAVVFWFFLHKKKKQTKKLFCYFYCFSKQATARAIARNAKKSS